MNDKTAQIEIDLSEFNKDILITLIQYAHERNLTFNEAIVELLKKFLNVN